MKAFSLGMDDWIVSSDEESEALRLDTELEMNVQMDDTATSSSPANQRKMRVAVSPLHVAQSQEGMSPSPPSSPIIGGRRTPDVVAATSPIPPEPSRTSSIRGNSTGLQQLKKQVSTCGVRP